MRERQSRFEMRGRVNQFANPNVLSKISDQEKKEERILRADDDIDALTFLLSLTHSFAHSFSLYYGSYCYD